MDKLVSILSTKRRCFFVCVFLFVFWIGCVEKMCGANSRRGTTRDSLLTTPSEVTRLCEVGADLGRAGVKLQGLIYEMLRSI